MSELRPAYTAISLDPAIIPTMGGSWRDFRQAAMIVTGDPGDPPPTHVHFGDAQGLDFLAPVTQCSTTVNGEFSLQTDSVAVFYPAAQGSTVQVTARGYGAESNALSARLP